MSKPAWVKELKREISIMPAPVLPTYRPLVAPEKTMHTVVCRKCRAARETSVGQWSGPACVYEPPFRPNWWQRLIGRNPTPERMRRECSVCKAVYYEDISRLVDRSS